MKNIFIKLLPLILLVSGIGIASADTRVVVYTNGKPANAGAHTVSIPVEFHLNKETYNPGEIVYPTVTYSQGHVTCSNGASIDRPLYTRPIFETGNPDTSTYLQLSTVSQPYSNIYYNTQDKYIYYNGEKVTTVPTSDENGYEIISGSLNMYISDGVLKGYYSVKCRANDSGYGSGYGNYYYGTETCYNQDYDSQTGQYYYSKYVNEGTLVSYLPTSMQGVSTAYIESYTPYIYNVSTGNRPVNQGHLFLGIQVLQAN